jgi:DNA-binding NtrC family response regulator
MVSTVGGAGMPGRIESLMLCHLNFPVPGVSGFEAPKKIKNIAGDVEVISVTQLRPLAHTVEAIQNGQRSGLNQGIGGIS